MYPADPWRRDRCSYRGRLKSLDTIKQDNGKRLLRDYCQSNGTGNPVIESDYIDSNDGGMNYAGIIFDNASGHVNFDTLSNNYDGIHCYDYGSPYTSGPAGGQNIVINNGYGIYADTYSSPVFGHAVGNPPVTYDGTCNQFYSNSSDNLYAVNNSSITAEKAMLPLQMMELRSFIRCCPFGVPHPVVRS